MVKPVIEEINRGIGRVLGVHLDLHQWETDTYPGFHVDGGQAHIDPLLRVEESDLLIGVFWTRFGGETKTGVANTEHEIRTAIRAREVSGRPQIMLYFSGQPVKPKSLDREQYAKVEAFQKEMGEQGLYWDYDGPASFEGLLRTHLTLWLTKEFAGPKVEGEEVPIPPKTNAPKKAKDWRIPLPSAYFTGQTEYLERLDAILAAGGTGGITQPTGLQGFGGIGKTELALAYAQLRGDRYEAGHFIVAESLAALDSGLARIAEPDLLADATKDSVDALKQKALRELAAHEHTLVIFDNVDEIVQTPEFKEVLGQLPRAHVLLTCRHQDMGAGVRQVAVEKMDEGVGALYVLRFGLGDEVAGPWKWEDFSEGDRASAKLLAHELDGLPLALHHAGSAIRGEGISAAEVLADYQSNRGRILSNRGRPGELTHPESAQVTVVRAYEKLREKDTAAAELVLSCAYLAPDSISEDLFTGGLVEVEPALAEARGRWAAVRAAARESGLIDRITEEKRLTIHRVTQAILEFKNQASFAKYSARVTTEAVLSLLDKGRYQEAVAHAEFDRTESIRVRGAGHPDTLASKSNLASTYWFLGRHAEALKLEEETLAARRNALGESHPDTLTSMNNLATTYSDLGRYGEALNLKEETLAARRKVLGEGHPDTLTSMNNLAQTYSALGRHEEALRLHEETLTARRKALGEGHSDTLTSMNNLAATYFHLGRHREAFKLQEETFVASRKVRGEDHPDTLSSMNNLATMYSALGRHEEALKLKEETLAALRKALGEGHPDTLASMNNLATTYWSLGRYSEALELLEETLAARRKALGEEHPSTLTSMNNLAQTYSALGRHAEALDMFNHALLGLEAAFGPDHPSTKMVRENRDACLR